MTVRRLWRDCHGGVALMTAAMMPVLIGFAAFAVDLGAIQLDTRRLQGMADAAALAAASAPTNGGDRANAVVRGSGFPRDVTVRVNTGVYLSDPTIAPNARFKLGLPNPDAARVTLESTSPTFFGRILGTGEVPIARHATARRQRFAAFQIGSRLASLNGGILNQLLSALTGSEVKLSVADYNALAGAQIDLLGLLPILRTEAGLNAVTFDDILAAQVTTPKLLDAISEALSAQDQTTAAGATELIANISGGQSVALSALIDAGPLGRQADGGTGIAQVDALSLITAILQLAGPDRQVALNLGATIPGLASTRVFLAVGDRMQQSPWVTVTDNGAPIVRTAQVRAYVRAELLPLSLPLIGPLAKINLPILIELASAEGRLSAINCGGTGRSVTLEGRPNLGTANIGTVVESNLNNFSVALSPSSAKLVDTALIDVLGSAKVSLGEVEQWRLRTFTDAEIANGTTKTIASSSPLQGVATSLVRNLKLDAQVIGLPLPVGGLLSAVGSALGLVTPALDTLLMTVTGALGVGVGEADLRVTGVRCGQAILVA